MAEEKLMFEKYRILDVLSGDSYSDCLLAEHVQLGEKRIIKRIARNSGYCDQLMQEAERIRSLKTDCIPVIYDIWENDNYYCIIEEYIEGETLKALCARRGILPEEEAVGYIAQLLSLFKVIHDSGRPLYYLDLHPGNVIISEGMVKLVDFGASRYKDDDETRLGRFGTDGFSAPELKERGYIDERSDIYSLGKILSYMLGDRMNRRLRRFTETCTSQNPAERYRYADEAAAALNTATGRSAVRYGNAAVKRNHNSDSFGMTVIGILGIRAGVGTTHFTIALANYLAEKKHKKVAVIEMSGNADIQHLYEERFTTQAEVPDTFFPLFGVDYYYGGNADLGRIRNRHYDFCVLDLGHNIAVSSVELLRCSRKVIIADSAVWHMADHAYIKKLEEMVEYWESWYLLLNFSLHDDIRRWRDAPMRILCSDFSPDPFRISGKMKEIINRITG